MDFVFHALQLLKCLWNGYVESTLLIDGYIDHYDP